MNNIIAAMYHSLDHNICECEYDDQGSCEAWDCYVCDFAGECLDAFTEEDWEMLFQELPSKSTIWKKRLTDCIIGTTDDSTNANLIRALLCIVGTDEDMDLFTQVIATLNDFDLSEVDSIRAIYDKVKNLLPDADGFQKIVFERFLKEREEVTI